MALLGFFLDGVASVLSALVWFFFWIFLIYALLSFVNPDPRNIIVQIINGICEPILAPFRKRIRPWGMFDMAFLVVVFGLIFIDRFLVQALFYYANVAKMSAPGVVGGGI